MEKTWKREGMRPRSPRRHPVFGFVSRVLLHLRVGGIEAGQGAGEPGGADVGAYAFRWRLCQRGVSL